MNQACPTGRPLPVASLRAAIVGHFASAAAHFPHVGGLKEPPVWLAVGFDSDGQAPWFTMRIDLPESEAVAVMLGEVVALCSKRGHPGLWQQTAGVPS